MPSSNAFPTSKKIDFKTILALDVPRGAHVKNLRGVLNTRDRLFTKIVLQRHHATDAQTYISILLADATYFYHHCFKQFLLLRKPQS